MWKYFFCEEVKKIECMLGWVPLFRASTTQLPMVALTVIHSDTVTWTDLDYQNTGDINVGLWEIKIIFLLWKLLKDHFVPLDTNFLKKQSYLQQVNIIEPSDSMK